MSRFNVIRQRRGSMLIEVTINLVAGSTLMVLAISSVHQAFKIASETRLFVDQSRTITALARQFRSDVHAAEKIEAWNKSSLTILQSDGSRTVYMAINHRVSRLNTDSNNEIQRESYDVGQSCELEFGSLLSPSRVSLSIDEVSEHTASSHRSVLHVEAVVGLSKVSDAKESQ
jgi:hypothetical protein